MGPLLIKLCEAAGFAAGLAMLLAAAAIRAAWRLAQKWEFWLGIYVGMMIAWPYP